jgi:hypothetical protein
MQVSDAIMACLAAQDELRDGHAAAQPLLQALHVPARYRTASAWRWATGAISTRTMHLPGDSVGCLTPFADMHNYWPPPPPVPPRVPVDTDYEWPAARQAPAAPAKDAPAAVTTAVSDTNTAPELQTSSSAVDSAWQGVAGEGWYDEESHTYKIVALRDYNPGEQVYLCYGRYTSLELLQLYGFLLPKNAHDEITLPAKAWEGVPGGAAVLQAAGAFLHPGAHAPPAKRACQQAITWHPLCISCVTRCAHCALL